MNVFSQNEHMANMGNGSILPAALLSMLAARSQAAAAASNSPPPSNTAVDQLNNKHNTTSGGGIFVRDASQINNDISKLASVVAAANGDNQGVSVYRMELTLDLTSLLYTGMFTLLQPKEFSDPMELIRRMSYLKQAMEAPLGGMWHSQEENNEWYCCCKQTNWRTIGFSCFQQRMKVRLHHHRPCIHSKASPRNRTFRST